MFHCSSDWAVGICHMVWRGGCQYYIRRQLRVRGVCVRVRVRVHVPVRVRVRVRVRVEASVFNLC